MSSRKMDRMAWFKMDAGAFLGETRGLPLVHVGLYINLLNLYWARGNELPQSVETLKRQLGVVAEEEAKALQEVLAEFFPEGRHPGLDRQLQEVGELSSARAAAGRKGGSSARSSSVSSIPAPSSGADF